MEPVNYRDLRPNNILSSKYRHILLLLYWPLFGLVFYSLELFFDRTYHPVYLPMDDMIPFCEFFVIPYYFWFAFIFWIMIYSFFFDVPAFKKFSYFVIITYSITLIIYIFYPTMQQLRPTEFQRDNIFIEVVKFIYGFDTNTNVCPSIHVIGSFAVFFTAWHSKRYSTPLWRTIFVLLTVIICSSTIFVKQHSVIDIFWGLVISFAAYPFVYINKAKFAKKSPPQIT